MSLSSTQNSPAFRFPAWLAFAGATLVVAAFFLLPDHGGVDKAQPGPQIITLKDLNIAYRHAGEFLRNSLPVDAPNETLHFKQSLTVMKAQVSKADYGVCVQAGACAAQDNPRDARAGVPVTGVSFIDAQNYAGWLSEQTGAQWRLPSDEEWAAIAASRYTDDALNVAGSGLDPSKRWIAQYEKEANRPGLSDSIVHATGHFGANENGIVDLSGNVWEWTSTCYVRSTLAESGKLLSSIENCGVRVVEGKHRTYMTAFIRDAKGGGCSVGAPPEFLGFRLIREDPAFFSMLWLRGLFGR